MYGYCCAHFEPLRKKATNTAQTIHKTDQTINRFSMVHPTMWQFTALAEIEFI